MDNELFISMIQIAFTKFAPATQKSYNDELKFLARFLRDKRLVDVEPFDAQTYMRHLNRIVSCHDKKPLAPKTIRRKILSLYSIYSDAYNLDLIASNPFEKVAKIAREIKIFAKRESVHVPFEQVALVVNDAPQMRDRAIFAVLFGGGLRVSELCRLKREDVKRVGDLVGLHVLTAKTNKLRPVTLPLWASKIVWEYRNTHKKEWLFPAPTKGGKKPLTRKWISNLCFANYGYRAHTARHTHISYLLSKKVPVVDIAKSVGHESITSTLIYDRRILDYNSSVGKEADFFI